MNGKQLAGFGRLVTRAHKFASQFMAAAEKLGLEAPRGRKRSGKKTGPKAKGGVKTPLARTAEES